MSVPLKFYIGDYSSYEITILTNQRANQGTAQASRSVIEVNRTLLRVHINVVPRSTMNTIGGTEN